MLRSRFQFVPVAFSKRFWTGSDRKSKHEESVLNFMFQNLVFVYIEKLYCIQAKYQSGVLPMEFLWQDETYERKNITYFSQVWNEFINSMREEDLIGNRSKLPHAYLTHLALDA